MLIIIVLVFYGIWLFNINKEIKKYREMEKKIKVLRKRVNGLDREVFGYDTTPICNTPWDDEETEEEPEDNEVDDE